MAVDDLNTGSARWRADLRVFNAGPASVSAVITFHESRRADGTLPEPMSRPATLQPGDVTPYDNVLQSLFGVRDVGGLVHITTPSDSSLVVTGRTYDRRPVGKYGQFFPAVTTAECVPLRSAWRLSEPECQRKKGRPLRAAPCRDAEQVSRDGKTMIHSR